MPLYLLERKLRFRIAQATVPVTGPAVKAGAFAYFPKAELPATLTTC